MLVGQAQSLENRVVKRGTRLSDFDVLDCRVHSIRQQDNEKPALLVNPK
jgi:hypothetical protein